jgi:hypothetical protein
MNKKKAGAVFIVLLTCGLVTHAFAQGQEIKFNSPNAVRFLLGNVRHGARPDSSAAAALDYRGCNNGS